jgi:uncharacterized protein YyaL (SSP411 family)
MSNRLAKEKSPYLLQHANNPVDWYPWSDEAFAKAIDDDKPVFLSIGYSTCHWCHVMERESFEDEEIAQLMNDTFICIKVDREERPDIDNIYMTVCSMMTGGGGWPLTIIMTPDKKPFFAGTYFAKHTSGGRMGMLDMIPRLNDIWKNRRKEVLKSTDNILDILQQQVRVNPGDQLDRKILHDAYKNLESRYDSDYGGFSLAPKFPTPHIVTFLLRHWKATGNTQALSMAENTLVNMRFGGVYDHIGFGFHRYSTDAKWLLPHFEKMLYDQALLAVAYLETYQISGNPLLKLTAEEIFTYVLRDMTAPGGGFYSAEDADSEGVEGKFYVWTSDELKECLSSEQFNTVSQTYNIKSDGNFHDEATGAKTGANIFHLTKAHVDYKNSTTAEIAHPVRENEAIRSLLFEYRKKRIHPHKDDKILTDWNGLMLGALAMGARIFSSEIYLEAAKDCASFILGKLLDDNNKLLHRYRDGEAAIPGMLNDYAFLVWGLLELYEADFDPLVLDKAVMLNETMLDLFWDDAAGGLFLTSSTGESLLIRPKEIYDGALPSGNSIALNNFLRIERLTGDSTLGHKADMLTRAFSETLKEVPSAYTQFLAGLYFMLEPSTEIVIVGNRHTDETRIILSRIRGIFSPNSVITFKNAESSNDILDKLAPFTKQYNAIDGKTTAYVCRNFSCESPTSDPDQIIKSL